MVISKKTVVKSLALVAIICIVMCTTEATNIGGGAMATDRKGCTSGACEGQANPYTPGCESGEKCRGS
ncbi:hypothetical protein YC2023_103715 [Brassica napus]|uniref:Uncharacterized protein n=2 Tax=Brassica TaxID=3705 RepID=A0A3P6GRY2_BRAOL|nr:unnamed protein product [Brassica napus]VDD58652.1 unnamed protein product [Brassica oleracea]